MPSSTEFLIAAGAMLAFILFLALLFAAVQLLFVVMDYVVFLLWRLGGRLLGISANNELNGKGRL